MKKSQLRRARIAKEERQAFIAGMLVVFTVLGVLALWTAPSRREYSAHMMCVYGHQEYCK